MFISDMMDIATTTTLLTLTTGLILVVLWGCETIIDALVKANHYEGKDDGK